MISSDKQSLKSIDDKYLPHAHENFQKKKKSK
jgi:hypothetical protein